MKSNFLQPILDAGSSRVFHVLSHTQRITTAKEPPERLFFNVKSANKVIILKSPLTSGDETGGDSQKPIRTKLFFPFNDKNLYEGGKSILVGDPSLAAALEDQWAVSQDRNPEDFAHDMAILDALDQLPSLDPFLMRDKFEVDAITVNQDYFDVAPSEVASIRNFIRAKMLVIAEFALGDQKEDSKAPLAINRLTEKLWEAKDIEALGPVLAALRLEPDKALSAIYSWKGLIFYDHEFNKQKSRWREMAEWVAMNAETRDSATPFQQKELKATRQEVSVGMKRSWNASKTEIERYQAAFDRLFVEKKSPDDFVRLLNDASKIFWLVGDHLSRLGHCLALWERVTSRYPRRVLPNDPLFSLLSTMARIFVGA